MTPFIDYFINFFDYIDQKEFEQTCLFSEPIKTILGELSMHIKIQIFIIHLLFLGSLKAEIQPESYSESNVRQCKFAKQELSKLNFSGKEKILDIGSGDGQISCYIAKKFIPNGQLVGIDNSAEMIAFASSRKTSPNVSYICANALDYRAFEKYNAIVSFSTLHWIEPYSKVLENIAHSLKPGGYALLCHGIETPPFPPIVQRLLTTQKWHAYQNNAEVLKYPSLIEVASAIKKSGLSIENLELKKYENWILPDVLIKNWLSLPLFDFIPVNLREEFCKEVLEEFIKQYPLNDKNELFHWSPVIVIVLKK